jgi:hypothetical protein
MYAICFISIKTHNIYIYICSYISFLKLKSTLIVFAPCSSMFDGTKQIILNLVFIVQGAAS